jgi:hypothetical protein
VGKSTLCQTHKFCYLLVAFLCILINLCIPENAQASPSDLTYKLQESEHSEEPAFVFNSGEIASGEVEAIIQLNKSLLLPLFYAVLSQLYPSIHTSDQRPGNHPSSAGDCGKHPLFSQGP